MNRGECRRRNKVIYDRRSKLFYQVWHHPYIPCKNTKLDLMNDDDKPFERYKYQ